MSANAFATVSLRSREVGADDAYMQRAEPQKLTTSEENQTENIKARSKTKFDKVLGLAVSSTACKFYDVSQKKIPRLQKCSKLI